MPAKLISLEEKRKALARFEEALSSIPPENKKDYLEATKQAPQLVATESDPMKFIRHSSHNFWSAADHMCSYWKERVLLFKEKAFLPLTMDGNGAMNDEDIMALQAGFPAMLPSTSDGRQVLYFDRRKHLKGTDRENRLRVTFYLLNLASNEERSQQEGGVIYLENLVQPRIGPVDDTFVERCISLIENALPVHVQVDAICNLPRTMSRSAELTSKITDYISLFHKPRGTHWRPNLHFEINKGEDFLRIFKGMGLRDEGIPESAGGSWKFDNVTKWCKTQLLKEGHHNTDVALGKSLCMAQQSTENPGKRRKIMNTIFSRQKRERRQQELQDLKAEHHRLEESNTLLKEEETRLEGLLSAAKDLVSTDIMIFDPMQGGSSRSSSSSSRALPMKLGAQPVHSQCPTKRTFEDLYSNENNVCHPASKEAKQGSVLLLLDDRFVADGSGKGINKDEPVDRKCSSFLSRSSSLLDLANVATMPLTSTNQDTSRTDVNNPFMTNPATENPQFVQPAFPEIAQVELDGMSNKVAVFNKTSSTIAVAENPCPTDSTNMLKGLPPALTDVLMQSNQVERGFLTVLLQQSKLDWFGLAKKVLCEATPTQQEEIQSWLAQQDNSNGCAPSTDQHATSPPI